MANLQNTNMKTQIVITFCIGFLLLNFYSCKNEPIEPIKHILVPTGLTSSEPNLHKADDGTIN